MKYMAWLLFYSLFIDKLQFSGGLSRENTEILPGQYFIETFLATYPETQQEANLCSLYWETSKKRFWWHLHLPFPGEWRKEGRDKRVVYLILYNFK